MTKKNRLLALFMTFVLLFSSISFAVSAESAAPTRLSEIEAMRQTNSETYLMSDGSYQCVVYAYDKYYEAADNTLQLVDNRIVAASATERTAKLAADKTQYKNAANAFDVHFSDSSAPEISIAYSGASITFSPISTASNHISTQICDFSVGKVNNCTALNELTYTGDNTVTYSNAFSNTDLVYVLDSNALKEYIILNNANASNTFSFLFTLDGVTLNSMDKYAEFVDENGATLFALDSLFAVDADGAFTEALTYSFVPVKGTNTVMVTVTLDSDYLSDADRVFPVIIDPTVMISSSETADACVCSYTETTNYQTASQLRTGFDTDYGIRRSYIKFNIPSSIPAGSITNANLHIEKLSGASPLVKAYRCIGSWSSASITWKNKPSYTTTNESTLSAVYSSGSAWYTMDVSSIVQSWVNGTYSNYGFVLKDLNENDSDHWTTIYSSDAPSPHKPELYISYVTESQSLSVSSTTSGYLSAGFIDKYTFTPSVTGKYSLWTTGTTDTLISVYSNSSLTELVGQADEGGHSLNACKTLRLIAGDTYYIVVAGASASTYGSYALKLYRGLPMSGGEQPNNSYTYNNSTYQAFNNCYTYALSIHQNPITGQLFDERGVDPGELGGQRITIEDLANATTAKSALLTAIKADCVAWGGSLQDFYEVDYDDMVPAGYYKIAIVIDPYYDYHFYRQPSDLAGRWAHKPGIDPVSEKDNSQADIYVPSEADTGDYTVFVGYFALKPPGSSSSSAISIDAKDYCFENAETNEYFIRSDISTRQFDSFQKGLTTKQQVKELVGEAHTQKGQNFVWDIYYTIEGDTIEILFQDDLIFEIRTHSLKSNGENPNY